MEPPRRAADGYWSHSTLSEPSCVPLDINDCRVFKPRSRPDLQLPSSPAIAVGIDRDQQRVYSEYLRRSRIPLPDFVRLVRGETDADPRPNKAWAIPVERIVWSYAHRTLWRAVFRHGLEPTWLAPLPSQAIRPKNHPSLASATPHLVRHLRPGQDAGQLLVLDLSLADTLGVFVSPFGAVPKGGASLSENARLIHDLSLPDGASIHDFSERLEVEVTYDGPTVIVKHIVELQLQQPCDARLLAGDVNSAFRHTPLHANHVGRFGGAVPELGVLVVDLCCSFGWTNSPAGYWVAGDLIEHLHAHGIPPPTDELFHSTAWRDEHNCVKLDIGSRLADAETSLRRAMTDVLGPAACNDEKFTEWRSRGKSLGLLWDLRQQTVSMSPEKLAKALDRVRTMRSGPP